MSRPAAETGSEPVQAADLAQQPRLNPRPAAFEVEIAPNPPLTSPLPEYTPGFWQSVGVASPSIRKDQSRATAGAIAVNGRGPGGTTGGVGLGSGAFP